MPRDIFRLLESSKGIVKNTQTASFNTLISPEPRASCRFRTKLVKRNARGEIWPVDGQDPTRGAVEEDGREGGDHEDHHLPHHGRQGQHSGLQGRDQTLPNLQIFQPSLPLQTFLPVINREPVNLVPPKCPHLTAIGSTRSQLTQPILAACTLPHYQYFSRMPVNLVPPEGTYCKSTGSTRSQLPKPTQAPCTVSYCQTTETAIKHNNICTCLNLTNQMGPNITPQPNDTISTPGTPNIVITPDDSCTKPNKLTTITPKV